MVVPALADVTLHVEAGEWVGVVGATGAGKSSLLSVLLRLVEIESGRICLYGQDVRTLPLARLRSRYGVVPQSPFLITGSIRLNLDPGGQHSDQALQRALQAVHLWEPLCAMITGRRVFSHDSGTAALNSTTASAALVHAVLTANVRGSFASGSAPTASHTPSEQTQKDESTVFVERVGLSAGQQQLMCLARLMLSGRQVVLLDEVTANIDRQTASVVDQVLRSWLSSNAARSGDDSAVLGHSQMNPVTVLQVAHNLGAVMDHTRIVVMSKGQVVQVGPPLELLQAADSPFAQLAAAHNFKHTPGDTRTL